MGDVGVRLELSSFLPRTDLLRCVRVTEHDRARLTNSSPYTRGRGGTSDRATVEPDRRAVSAEGGERPCALALCHRQRIS